jgi:sortase A
VPPTGGEDAGGGRRVDPWDRPAPQGRPDDWNQGDRAPAGGWDTVLPPVRGAPRKQEQTGAGVDEATAFMSQWGPPPLRPTEGTAGSREWDRPPPSRTGASGSADNPVTPPRSGPDWSRPAGPSAALPPVADAPPTSPTTSRASPIGGPQVPGAPPASPTGGPRLPDAPPASPIGGPRLPSAPTEPAAERWIADRLAADRSAAGAGPDDDFAGYWATDRPAKRRARPAEQDGSATDESPDDRPGTGERFAGYWVMGQAEERGDEHPGDPRGGAREDAGKWLAGPGGTAGGETPGEERFAGYWARDPGERQGAVRDEPTEVMGPFDVGAWSRDAAASPARPRGRQRQAEGTGPVTEQRDDVARKGGGGGEQPPSRGGGNGGPQRPRRTFGDRIRTFLRGIGQTFLTLGLVLLLLAVYEVWFTDLVNHRTQKDLTTSLQTQWDNGDDPTVGTVPTRPGEKVRNIPLGDGFALIYIPDFGTDYVFTVVEGTDLDELNKGPGHYVDTPLPGAVGNVAIAGHRVGKGSPFLNLDKLKAGSAIVIRTRTYWYTYRVVGDPGGSADTVSALGFPGREIVDPSDVAVIAPVPDKPGATPTRRLLTLTTCHPKFTARQRMVIHAELDGTPFPVGKGTPPSMTSG